MSEIEKRLDKQCEAIEKMEVQVSEMHTNLIGNKKYGTKGVIEKVNEMHSTFAEVDWKRLELVLQIFSKKKLERLDVLLEDLSDEEMELLKDVLSNFKVAIFLTKNASKIFGFIIFLLLSLVAFVLQKLREHGLI